MKIETLGVVTTDEVCKCGHFKRHHDMHYGHCLIRVPINEDKEPWDYEYGCCECNEFERE